jgi:hypothetical protein
MAEGRTHVHLGRNELLGVELTLSEVRDLRDVLSALLVAADPS